MKSKLLVYWEQELKNSRNRYLRAMRYYNETQESCWKYICNFGFRNQELEETCKKAFLNAGKMFLQYQQMIFKFNQIKGNLGLCATMSN